jgi:hypothetical protein
MTPMTTADHNDDGLLFDPVSPNRRWHPYSRKFGFVSPNSFAHWHLPLYRQGKMRLSGSNGGVASLSRIRTGRWFSSAAVSD